MLLGNRAGGGPQGTAGLQCRLHSSGDGRSMQCLCLPSSLILTEHSVCVSLLCFHKVITICPLSSVTATTLDQQLALSLSLGPMNMVLPPLIHLFSFPSPPSSVRRGPYSYFSLALNLLFSLEWPWTQNPPASQMLGL